MHAWYVQPNLFITDNKGTEILKCPYYRGVRFREAGFIWISVSQGPSELERCLYYRRVRKERFHCTCKLDLSLYVERQE